MSKFFKSGDLKVLSNGYLVDGDNNPWMNEEFVKAQQQAEIIIKFAEACKGKNFKQVAIDNPAAIWKQVLEEVSNKNLTSYLDTPIKPNMELTNKLQTEAMSWMNFHDESTKTADINAYMQRFNVINDFENVGIFFTEGVVKISKIYTIEEIKAALVSNIDHIAK